ncbi:hypothetical protein [Hymenobacter persicinus]|uniref:Glycosyltransferase RgtA/B/C/D-like domain-containing protein n=1 Tax=Hymenobacter persicinus TaxID=2025506 RepID=A0A4Q5L8L4_9BACT|nr:hypothetical protein [Hymenobacter persicinus]RYU78007.1 hypothetical protein EWM57_15680 [Hymenobacter persicinus]
MKSPSGLALFCSAVFIVLVSFWYYPKWKQPNTEASISWDASGYYMYLPAIFIYHDLKDVKFRDEVIAKYQPSPTFDQAFVHPGSGHYVMKYSSGLALQVLPFFLVAHAVAERLGYPADGFSPPYQFALQFASIVMCLLGLFLVRKALRPRFGEWPTALALLVLVLGTNYLDYAAINGAMTHNWLFTWYAVLMLVVPAFYKRPTMGRALAIGGVIGLMTLTRPTELMAVLIPLLWGLEPSVDSLRGRLEFWQQHWPKLVGAAVIGALFVSIQPLYWHYVTGDWIVYSYQDQGFSWLRPHLWDGLFSFRSGWLLYSPLSILPLLGLLVLRRQVPEGFWAILIFMLAAIYVAYAWDIWWYGGRAMVQSYGVMVWPLAALMHWLGYRRGWAEVARVAVLLGIYFNLWLTHMSHLGSLYYAGDMNRAYLWRILGRFQVPEKARLLLDSNADYTGTPTVQHVLWTQDFESANPPACDGPALRGNCSLALDGQRQNSEEYVVPLKPGTYDWVRASVLVHCDQKEWDMWKMTQYTIRFRNGSTVVKEKLIRLQRALNNNQTDDLHIDVRAPREAYDNVTVSLWNGGGTNRIVLDDLTLIGIKD